MGRWWSVLAAVALAGCASQPPAPVVERATPTVAAKVQPSPAEPREGFYTVKKGDTLYRIALDHGHDYKDLAAWNSLENPGRIEVGQQLRVMPPDGVAVAKPVAAPATVLVVASTDSSPTSANTDTLKREPRGGKLAYSDQALNQVKTFDGGVPLKGDEAKPLPKPVDKPLEKVVPPPLTGDEALEWMWPAAGKLLSQFVEGSGGKESNKGVDIAGRVGDPVQSASAGKVVYVGSGLRGYGNLVIVRHNATFLSAYAHNSKVLVKEGQTVTQGQKIAELGSSDADQPKLHFEIRRQGKPVDPLKYLPNR